jgi:hypothetical protein
MNRPTPPGSGGPPSSHTLTGAQQIVIPVPRTYKLGARRYRWSLLLFPIFVVGLALAVRDVSRVERTLAAEGTKAARVIVYELATGAELRIPIEPGTDVFRVVAHAMRRGNTLAPSGHVAHLTIQATGDQGSLKDDLSLTMPGTTERVTPEDRDLSVGDPVSLNVDVHGVGVGEMTVSLRAIEGADGALVRVYRRDALHALDAVRRTEHVDEERRAHFAHRAGELDWVDLDEAEQLAILGARWKKVGAFRGSRDLTARAIALAPPLASGGGTKIDAPIGVVSIRGDERAAFMARGPTSVHGTAQGDPEAPVAATVRYEDGTVANVEAKGELLLKVPDGNTVGIELSSASAKPIEVRAADPQRIEPPTHAVYWRATPTLPAIVTAGTSALVVRVTARRPVPRSATQPVSIELVATVASAAGATQATPINVTRARSPFDRYETREPMEAPTEKAVFYVIIPAGGTATLTPARTPIDLSLAELDPGAPPRTVASFGPSQARPAVEKVGEVDWTGFVSRRPSNSRAFEPNAHGIVRIAHRLVPAPRTVERAPSFRILRPRAGETKTIDKRIFDSASVTLDIEVTRDIPITLPVHLYSAEPIDIVARIDGGNPKRRALAVAERVTTARRISVQGEVKAIVVLGDDLAPGRHTLTFDVPEGKKAWVHVPWLVRHAPPRPKKNVEPADEAPRWVEGDFDN